MSAAPPGRQHALQFAAGNNIETSAELGEQIEDSQIGVGLDCVADQMLAPLERIRELAVAIGQGCVRIDIAGCAKALCDVGQRHLLGAKLVVPVAEKIGHIIYSGSVVAERQALVA